MDTTILTRDLERAKLQGDVINRQHGDYDRLRRVWNAMADRRPAAIVRPRTVADVQKTVSVAAEHGVLFAIRGGGHSLPGLSTCDDGIMLDMSLMNTVAVDAAAGRVDVGGGALLGDLDKATVPLGLVVPAGVVSHTGAAGLTLGGGMGWLSRRYGLTIDSLLAAEIVTADGRSRWIDAESEPDLFWAIRGGGGNFGVVTRFSYRTRSLGRALVGNWVYPPGDMTAVLRRYRDLAALAPRDVTTSFVVTSADLLITAIATGDSAPAAAAVAPFGEIGRPVSGSVGALTFLDLQQRSDDRMAWNRRYYAKGGYLQDIDDRVIDHMVDRVATAPTAHAEFYVLQLGGAIADVDDDATAYTGRAAGFYWIVESGWDAAADDAQFLSWSRSAAAGLADMSMRGNYVNEQGDVGKDVAVSAYGEQKYDKLGRLKSRFDPANLFRLNQNIEPRP